MSLVRCCCRVLGCCPKAVSGKAMIAGASCWEFAEARTGAASAMGTTKRKCNIAVMSTCV